MKTKAVQMETLTPKWECKLIQDTNGNWFATCDEYSEPNGLSSYATGTYTTPEESIMEAVERSICLS